MPLAISKFGPYYDIERRRREVSRKALGMEPTPPAQLAGEEYGARKAELSEERAGRREQFEKGLALRQVSTQEKAQEQQSLGLAIRGIGSIPSLIQSGAGAGKALGLWGGAKAITSPWAITGAEEALGGLAGIGGAEAVAGGVGAAGAAGGVGGVAGAAIGGVAGAAEAGIGAGAGILTGAEEALGGLAGISGTTGFGAAGAGVTGITAGAETGLFGLLGLSSFLGPVGIGLGLVGGLLSTIFGDEISKLFK